MGVCICVRLWAFRCRIFIILLYKLRLRCLEPKRQTLLMSLPVYPKMLFVCLFAFFGFDCQLYFVNFSWSLLLLE